MSNSTSSAEQFFLKLFKIAIMAIMSLALVATVIALIAALYLHLQSPKAVEPAKKAPEQSVSIDDFLKQLKPEKVPEEEEDKQPAKPAPSKSEPTKYMDEARKIIACVKQSNEKAGLDVRIFSDDVIDSFRRDLQRVADDSLRDRGQPYATDVVRAICLIMLNDKVVELRKKDKDLRVFIPAVNYHMRKWDEIRTDVKRFEKKEAERVDADERAELMRVLEAKQNARMMLIAAASTFGLFMAIALYLIIAAIESNLRRLSQSFEDWRREQKQATGTVD